jgi:hypothetical protein
LGKRGVPWNKEQLAFIIMQVERVERAKNKSEEIKKIVKEFNLKFNMERTYWSIESKLYYARKNKHGGKFGNRKIRTPEEIEWERAYELVTSEDE